jgi:hypothetical protein
MFLFTREFWLRTALIIVAAGSVLRALCRRAFLNFLGWMMLAAGLGGLLAGPVWVAQAYGFGALIATVGIVLLVVLATGLWLLVRVRRLTECVG